MNTFKKLTSIFFVASSLVFSPLGNNVFSNRGDVLAQPVQQGVVFDPPSNVRTSPNGPVLCKVTASGLINIYGSSNGWYVTDVCGQRGYIHSGQVRLQSGLPETERNDVGDVVCSVVHIQQGQLAVRFSPGGESKAGLNNGNTVQVLGNQGIWSRVRVIQGPNRGVNGVQGWVNSNYLSCN